MPKFILLNGPPRSGKDTAAMYLVQALRNTGLSASEDKFSAPLKRGFAGIVLADMQDFEVLGYEFRKEETLPAFGVSFRQFQIDMSEKFMKPLYGQDIFSKLLIARAKTCLDEFIVVSDCGFQHEYNYFAKHAECWLISITRPNTDFNNDSRQWVRGEPDRMAVIDNRAGLVELEYKAQNALYSLKIIGE